MNTADRKRFKALAHSLKPVVMVGQAGLTAAVMQEIEIALDSHELIKIRIRAEREERDSISAQICAQTHAELIQKIGQISTLYRLNPDKN